MELQQPLHVVLFPMMAHGHMIPSLDMATLFISRGLRATIVATPAFSESISRAQESGLNVGLNILPFPPENSKLSPDIVSLDQITADITPDFLEALSILREPLEKLLVELRPDCLISDMFLPWTADLAAKFGIPRLIFHGVSCFALCTWEQICVHEPYKDVSSDTELFSVPNLKEKL